tara:strand:+ start:34 stop:501 length:468 start_codon:yes stop_codon:yes gene_type:complete
MTQTLKIGSKAPDFLCAADGDRQVALDDYAGKKLVIYFYPKDDTPGCTTEAIDFTDKQASFTAANVEIIGVSADSVEKHEKFKSKHSLGVTLLSDPDQKMLEAYGVWVEKNMYGKKYMGIERATFLVSEDGKILHVWRKVRVKGHVNAVLEMVRA